MKYYVQNLFSFEENKEFTNLKKACEYAVAAYEETGDLFLIHIGSWNLAQTYGQSTRDLWSQCKAILSTYKRRACNG